MNEDNSESDSRLSEVARFPALAALRLEPGDLSHLMRQGSVAQEQRGDHAYFKLRFRRDGRQVVRYIGDAATATIVIEELARLQSPRRLGREFAQLGHAGRRLLRETKATLEPLVIAHGMYFHGRTIRQPRRSRLTIAAALMDKETTYEAL